jgi:hypothetical protein
MGHHLVTKQKKFGLWVGFISQEKRCENQTQYDSIISNLSNHDTWWLIPHSKWIITPVINGISRVNPLITGVITHLLSGMSHQVYIHIYSQLIPSHRWYTMLESAGWDFQKGFRRHGFCVLSFKWSSQNTATKHPTKQPCPWWNPVKPWFCWLHPYSVLAKSFLLLVISLFFCLNPFFLG